MGSKKTIAKKTLKKASMKSKTRFAKNGLKAGKKRVSSKRA